MSDLQRKIQAPGLLPMMPPRQAATGGRVFGRKRDYSPLPWSDYYDARNLVQTQRGTFCVYTKGSEGPLVVALHGGGFSALTWALFAKDLVGAAVCQLLAIDQRGHGDTSTDDDSDLDIKTMAVDVGAVLAEIYKDVEAPHIILLGHSMGGAVAVHASTVELVPTLIGLIVIDVVEGSALESLSGMKPFLRGRPPMFKSVETAIEWSVRSGQIKNSESARVSFRGQLKPCKASPGASAATSSLPTDTISEEPEESPSSTSDQPADTDTIKEKSSDDITKQPHTWRINLEKTEPYWEGWYKGLSSLFLDIPVPKVLLLAGVDRLDKELAVGQMQGKFQMQIVGHVGHAVHEDAPDKVADVVATFMVRNKFAEEGQSFHRTFPAC